MHTWDCKNPVTEKTSLVLSSDGYTEFTGQRGKREAFGAEGTSCGNHSGWEGTWQVWEGESRPVWPVCRLRKRMVGHQIGEVRRGPTVEGLTGHVQPLSLCSRNPEHTVFRKDPWRFRVESRLERGQMQVD